MLLGKCWPHGARGAAEPQTRAYRPPCANTRARKGTQARAHSRARLALRMPVRRTIFFSVSLSTAFPLSPPLCISRGAAARAQCAAAVLCTMLMLDDTRASECGVRARIKSSAHLLGEGTTGCRRLSSVTFQAKTLSA